MPNIQSQVKRAKTSAAANATNSAEKNRCRTAIKKVEVLAKEGKKEEAAAALREAIALLDRLAQKGIIAKNSADRKKAHLQGVVANIK